MRYHGCGNCKLSATSLDRLKWESLPGVLQEFGIHVRNLEQLGCQSMPRPSERQ